MFQSGWFNHYERQKVGEVITLEGDAMSLSHNTLLYFNLYVRNVLGAYIVLHHVIISLNTHLTVFIERYTLGKVQIKTDIMYSYIKHTSNCNLNYVNYYSSLLKLAVRSLAVASQPRQS